MYPVLSSGHPYLKAQCGKSGGQGSRGLRGLAAATASSCLCLVWKRTDVSPRQPVSVNTAGSCLCHVVRRQSEIFQLNKHFKIYCFLKSQDTCASKFLFS